LAKSGLGKGMEAIFSQVDVKSVIEEENIIKLDPKDIKPGKYQPRKDFKEEELDELAASIKEHGLLQPVIVIKEKDNYHLVVGERRWRAALKAEQKTIPAILRKKEEINLLEIALIENIQRTDLNPMEQAEAFWQLSEEFGMTQEEIAGRVGKNRVTVANTLRLLKLPEEIKKSLRKGEISPGHARAILMFDSQELQLRVYKKILEEGLSVRQSEELSREKAPMPEKKEDKKEEKPVEFINIEENLEKLFGTKVKINQRGTKIGKGKIEIDYYSIDDLNRIIEILQGGFYNRRKTLEDFL